MISIQNVSKYYGSEVLFKDINFLIHENDRLAIIGDNGVGKSTLMKIILDDSLATDGIVKKDKKSIGYLSQRVIEDVNNTVCEEFDKVYKKISATEKEMNLVLSQLESDPKNKELIAKYGLLENQYLQLGGYDKQIEIDKMLTAFNFSKDDINRKVISFSGGERTKIALIKLLLLKPDYLLLDEPTNHLDIQTIEWLEQYLKTYPGAILIISHDRFFLDKVVTRIIEIEGGTVSSYNTNYTNYLTEKKIRYDYELARYKRQQKEIKELNEFITRFRSKPSKIGQVNDRKNKLERMEIIGKPINHFEQIEFEFEAPNLKKSNYIEIIDGDVGYENKPSLITNMNIKVQAADKIGIIGPNGIGKTTLLKTMLKQIPLKNGQLRFHQKLNVGYFDQQQNDLDIEKTIFEVIRPYMPHESDSYVRKYLGRFLFKRDDVFKKIKNLSGGEKVRVVLAQFVLEKYDLIILDEPTNHLDLKSKEVLAQALQAYKGTIICVSHDRYFMNQIIDKYILLNSSSYSVFEGKYDEYVNYLVEDTKQKKQKKQIKVKKNKKINKNLVKLENKISSCEQEIQLLIDQSMEETIYSDFERSQQNKKEILEKQAVLDNLMLEYEQEILKEEEDV